MSFGNKATNSDIHKAFEKLDTNKDGYVTFDEARGVLRQDVGLGDEQIERLIRAFDKNKDNKLSYEEFIWFYWKIHDKLNEMKAMFRRLDKDKDGKVTLEELKRSLAKQGAEREGLTYQELSALLGLYDANKDGHLDFEEFMKFWNDVMEKGRTDQIGSYSKVGDM